VRFFIRIYPADVIFLIEGATLTDLGEWYTSLMGNGKWEEQELKVKG